VPRLWRQIIKGEEGQALPIVLILLIVGGLIIAPTLNHVSTSLNAGRIVEENVRGIYAAEAGVEYVLWYLTQQLPLGNIPTQLPEEEQLVNQMEVSMLTDDEEEGTYTLYDGELEENNDQQYDWLDVAGEMEWIEDKKVYEYTITVTWQAEGPPYPTIVLVNVGVRLPIGYEYVEYSAEDFDGNLSTGEPAITQDWAGAHLLNWTTFEGDKHELIRDDSVTLTFNVTREITGEEEGEEEPEGDYTWVNSSQTSERGEVIGTLYSITAEATLPGDDEVDKVIARVRADVILYEGEETAEISIIRWQINPQDEG
jgi:hypothetical protein